LRHKRADGNRGSNIRPRRARGIRRKNPRGGGGSVLPDPHFAKGGLALAHRGIFFFFLSGRAPKGGPGGQGPGNGARARRFPRLPGKAGGGRGTPRFFNRPGLRYYSPSQNTHRRSPRPSLLATPQAQKLGGLKSDSNGPALRVSRWPATKTAENRDFHKTLTRKRKGKKGGGPRSLKCVFFFRWRSMQTG